MYNQASVLEVKLIAGGLGWGMGGGGGGPLKIRK
jgi:hypothetical protein